jgi:hypothetical protein
MAGSYREPPGAFRSVRFATVMAPNGASIRLPRGEWSCGIRGMAIGGIGGALPQAILAVDVVSVAHERSAQEQSVRESCMSLDFVPHRARPFVPRNNADFGTTAKSRPFAAGLYDDITRKSPPTASERYCVLQARGSDAQICDAVR